VLMRTEKSGPVHLVLLKRQTLVMLSRPSAKPD